MSIFHSTVSRREFMKGLGLVSAGVGGAMAAAPAFHDLDELIQSSVSSRKRAWWVKEVDEPTVEIDWSLMQRHYNYSTQSAAVVAAYPGLERYNAETATGPSPADRMKNNQPGYRLRDQALASANGIGNGALGDTNSNLKFGQKTVQTPEERGVPKWTGSAEEATLMLRAAMVFFGSAEIGTAAIDDHHQKLIGLTGENPSISYYDKQPPTTVTKPIVFSQTDSSFRFDDKTRITYLPNVPLYSVTYLIPQDSELNRMRPGTLGGVAQTRYRLREVPRACTQGFIQGLGYQSMLDEPYRAIPSNAGAVLGGLSENGRHSIMSISPEFGAFGGYFDLLTTLPLEHTKPIDAGMWRFCQSCGLCADLCPSGSIVKKGEGEPTWEVRTSNEPKAHILPWEGIRTAGEFHKLGRKTYWTDMPQCQLWVRRNMNGERCNVCWGNCVFNGANGAMIHQVVKATASVTPIFNSFFSAMHPTMGYGMRTGEDIEEWWHMSLPAYGFDSTVYAKHMGY
ncbi:reductive dehalogenase [Dehalogenimonas sp. 4OHTPN]|uniref:Reductive dehalogenase n=1 Tax=Dehalogenimonas sp. 4OHTPN TaxID=3166643 RepID=A0AAU8GBF0_9CHLR